jgi:hypothetical protein
MLPELNEYLIREGVPPWKADEIHEVYYDDGMPGVEADYNSTIIELVRQYRRDVGEDRQ